MTARRESGKRQKNSPPAATIGRGEARAGPKKFAEGVVPDANTFLGALENDPRLRDVPPAGSLDPEDWAIMRHYAQKILEALETDTDVHPAWIETICKCAEKRKGLEP